MGRAAACRTCIAWFGGNEGRRAGGVSDEGMAEGGAERGWAGREGACGVRCGYCSREIRLSGQHAGDSLWEASVRADVRARLREDLWRAGEKGRPAESRRSWAV